MIKTLFLAALVLAAAPLVLATAQLGSAGAPPEEELCDAEVDRLQLLQRPPEPGPALVAVLRRAGAGAAAAAERSHPEDAHSKNDEAEALSIGHAAGVFDEGSPQEHGKGELEHEASVAMQTTSYLLIGFLVTNFVMLWLVNWPDANVRSYAWKMMSAAISIYLAVSLTGSMTDIILAAFLPDKSNPSDKLLAHVTLGTQLCIFIGCFVVGNLLCFRYRDHGKWLYATHTIGGHITAFAGIGAFETLSAHHGLTYSALWVAVLSSAACLVLIRFVSMKIRRSIFGEPGLVEDDSGDEDKGEAGEVKADWQEGIREGEDDACAIITSFLITELVMGSFFAREGEGHASHSLANIKKLLLIEGMCLLALVATTYLVKVMDKVTGEGSHTVGYKRMVESSQMTVAMIMAWLALHLFNWASAALYSGVDHEFLEIITAAVLTVSALLGILILDYFADTVGEISTASDNGNQRIPRASRSNISDIVLDSANMEKAIRSIIDAMSLAVGLGWEKAFHAAISTCIETHSVLSHHPLLSEFGMAMANCFLMLPVWLRVIVPMARKSVKQHRAMMDLDLTQG